MSKKKILLNAFNMNCVGHINHGLWTHPRDQSQDYRKLSYWTDLAKLLERGLFDGLFIADIVGTYDVYQASVDLTLKESIQLPVNDPLMLVSAMAAVTQHLGFGVTVNLTYEAPYLLARRFSTLDHLTEGRIGWNIVTGYLDSASARWVSPGRLPTTNATTAPTNTSTSPTSFGKAVGKTTPLCATAARVFADPQKIHKVNHHGRYYDVEGYHLSEPSPQRTPVLFQAGSSGRGQAFAIRHAECVFVSSQSKEGTRKLVDALRKQAAEAGRDPASLKVFMGVTVVVGRTTAEAEEKFAEYASYANAEAGLAHFAAGSGIDYSKNGLDDELEPPGGHKSRGIESSVQRVTDGQSGWTVRRLLDQLKLGGRFTTIVGDPVQVADALESWMDETGIDGFNLTRTVTPESYEDFIDLVIPELQARGVYKTGYADGTLREKLFNRGARLPDEHTGASFRQVHAK